MQVTEHWPAYCVRVDSKSLASAGDDHKVILWSPDTGEKPHEWPLPGPVHCVAFAPDGRHLATGNSNGTIYIFRITELLKKWQAEEGK